MINSELYKWIVPCGADKSVPDKCGEHEIYRVEVARKELKKTNNPPSKEEIISYVNSFLESIGMLQTCFYHKIENTKRKVEYYKISIDEKYQGKIKDKRDIVWIKFTNDGYIGAVCVSNDVNFDYDNTSGKIINYVGQLWDESFVLLVPLCDIPDGLDRRSIESGIGNYLISKGVPILDYYSHIF